MIEGLAALVIGISATHTAVVRNRGIR